MDNVYEMMLISKADVSGEDEKKLLKNIDKILEDKGKISHSESLGKRELSYSIKKQTQGIYWLFKLNIIPLQVKNISDKLRMDEDILRYIILKFNEKKKTSKKDTVIEKEKKEVKKVTVKGRSRRSPGKEQKRS